jgi:hypothetical protein
MIANAAELPAAVVSLIDEAVREFRRSGKRASETNSFLRGYWQPAANLHPQLAQYRDDFFSLAGDACRSDYRQLVPTHHVPFEEGF